jgi:hypothetical protein
VRARVRPVMAGALVFGLLSGNLLCGNWAAVVTGAGIVLVIVLLGPRR